MDGGLSLFGVSSRVGWSGSSLNPSSPESMNRARHFPAEAWVQPSRVATDLLSSPSAHPRMILDRSASDCAVDAR